MKIYAISTESHRILRDEWFLPSIQDDFQVHIEELTQKGDGAIGSEAFNETMLRKVELILRAIDEMWGKWFIYSDVDVQFLRPFAPLATQCLQNRDICFQMDSPMGELCAGFFVARGNDRVKTLWTTVHQQLSQDLSQHDQTWLNRILDPMKFTNSAKSTKLESTTFLFFRALRLHARTTLFCSMERKAKLTLQRLSGINLDLLPNVVFGGGTQSGKQWDKHKPFKVPRNATIHHANFAAGIEAKIEQLKYVKSKTINT
jgi:hypothetical protein